VADPDRGQERLGYGWHPDNVDLQLFAQAVERQVFDGAGKGDSSVVDQAAERSDVLRCRCQLRSVGDVQRYRPDTLVDWSVKCAAAFSMTRCHRCEVITPTGSTDDERGWDTIRT
jgi:hypothetical protein